MIPVMQATVGWLLICAATVVFVGGQLSRQLARRVVRHPSLQGLVRSARRNALVEMILGASPDDGISDDELDGLIVISVLLAAGGMFAGGLFLVTCDTFGIQFRMFEGP
ncbi:hypothetical protein [[Mycobacterium] vasticus]|uniref:Uncharacterized protein n=1 Tax=[Mycobacterium] vasticus TaxID=2875777 RepID=A0ABU5Z2P5_9MYCO|nr:hypothetical protein [Mycolicibacter sp. MYC017]MEB3071661.1 hypothetical protein [Mycolicibacter sp. MYC017]